MNIYIQGNQMNSDLQERAPFVNIKTFKFLPPRQNFIECNIAELSIILRVV